MGFFFEKSLKFPTENAGFREKSSIAGVKTGNF